MYTEGSDKMKKIIILLMLVVLIQPVIAPSVVCMGDSITHGWAVDRDTNISYPSTLQTRLPTWAVYNCGLPGDQTSGMIRRFNDGNPNDDVLSKSPDDVIIMGGINDINHDVSESEIENNLVTMCQMAKQNNITPILLPLSKLVS